MATTGSKPIASRPAIEGKTNEDSKEVQTETLTLKATPLPDGRIKAKTGNTTDSQTYNNWYQAVYLPADPEETEQGSGEETGTGNTETNGAESNGAETNGTESNGTETSGTETGGDNTGGSDNTDDEQAEG